MKSIFSDATHRFFFIGGNTADEFCTPSLKLCNIEEVLFDHLKALGYERIVFYAGAGRGLYFYDKYSYDITLSVKKNGTNSREEAIPKKKKSLLGKGVIGRRLKRGKNQEKKNQEEVASTDSLKRAFSDTDMLSQFDKIIKDDSIKSAIVFANWEDFVTKTPRDIQRSLSQKIVDWDRLGSNNDNIVVSIMPSINLEKIKTISDNSELVNLNGKIFTAENQLTSQSVWISIPDKDEVENLVRYWSFKIDMKINWREFKECIDVLNQYVKETDTSLESLSRSLKNINIFDMENIREKFNLKIEKKGLEKLEELQGMSYLKEEFEKIINYVKNNLKSKVQKPIKRVEVSRIYGWNALSFTNSGVNLHISLTGNPGTGKSTIAKIIADIFKENQILDIGHIVKVTRDDLVGQYVGQTAIKTKEKISQAMGGVLFIDEAYTLSKGGENDFGQEAIDTIVEAMTDRNGEFSVIIAGYPDDMKKFIDSNVGLKRRFANKIHLEDYEPPILQAIFEGKMKKNGYSLSNELRELLPNFMQNWYDARDEKNFGNAGDAENLFDNMAKSASYDNRKELHLQDIPVEYQKHAKKQTENSLEDAFKKLDEVIGLDGVKSNIRDIINNIEIAQLKSNSANISAGHYIFQGNPGTGKTTVARIMGDILKELKVLKKGHFIEVTREDLVAQYTGQTAPKTKALLEKALGGVLFIDEAYSLSKGHEQDFGKEAIDTIVPFMENHKDDFTLIVAGYTNDMKKFLDANTGLKSRFTHTIDFEDYTNQQMLEIFKIFSSNGGYILDAGVEDTLLKRFEYSRKSSQHFGNGRDARKIFDASLTLLARRLSTLKKQLKQDDERLYTITAEDIEAPPETPVGKGI